MCHLCAYIESAQRQGTLAKQKEKAQKGQEEKT